MATEAVRQAVGGGCRSGWWWLLSVANAIEAAARGTVAGHRLGALDGGGGGTPPPLPSNAFLGRGGQWNGGRGKGQAADRAEASPAFLRTGPSIAAHDL